MKHDTQHLDFLMSQYADGDLDAPARKLVEQKLAGDAQARTLLKEHRDVQELLEDWGSRIPMIDWNQFDQQLAARLAEESAAPQTKYAWRYWLRPTAAAAALLFAAAVGYSWHAWSLPAVTGSDKIVRIEPAPLAAVNTAQISESAGGEGKASMTRVAIEEDTKTDRPTPALAAEHVHLENVAAAGGEHSTGATPRMVDAMGAHAVPGSARAAAPIVQSTTDALH